MGYRDLSQLVDIRGDVKRTGSFPQRDWSQIKEHARHHSVSGEGTDAHDIANWHVDGNGWPGPSYNFVILRDGTIQWVNSVNRATYHVGNHNTPLIGTCLIGDGSFTEAQEKSFADLHNALVNTDGLNIERLRGHNEYPGHSTNGCPGINMDTVRSAINNGTYVGGSSSGSSSGGSSSGAPTYNGQTFAQAHEDVWMQDGFEWLQEGLNDVMDAGLSVDGVFGQKSLNATRDFHDEYNLSSNGSANYGRPGPATKEKIEELQSGGGSNPSPNSGEGIVDYMNRIGMDSSYSNRQSLASQHGISNYRGTASQNSTLLNRISGGGSSGGGKSISDMADEVIRGDHGSGHSNRRSSLGISQSQYEKVRAEVNRRL